VEEAMPAKRPQYLPGHYYHIYNRGAHRRSIFREGDNYLFVLRKIKAYCDSLAVTLIAYCLMPNHYHFLVRQDGEHAAGLLPQRVFNSYSKAYNKRYGHSGTLFEDNYRITSVEDESHLMHLCRYIHANPVKHRLVTDVADWPYSNYLEWIEERDGTLVDRDFVGEHFSSPQNYCEFVSDYLAQRSLPEELENYLRVWEG
jgi:REP element-mobilizing transposase RayT